MQRKPFRKKRRASGALALTVILALAAVALVVAGNRLFVVREITVEGNVIMVR